MNTVRRYRLPIPHVIDAQILGLPHGARLLSVAAVPGEPGALDLWALVNPAQPIVGRRVLIVGTGDEVPTDAVFIGTTAAAGEGVWHVFEIQ